MRGRTLIERSAGAVVFKRSGNNCEYLLLKYPGGYYDFPRGNVEFGESDVDAAIREIREETGLEVRIIPGFSRVIEYFYTRNGIRVRKRVVYFLAEALGGEVKLSYEHTGYVWASYDRALSLISFESVRNVLRDAHNFLKQVNICV